MALFYIFSFSFILEKPTTKSKLIKLHYILISLSKPSCCIQAISNFKGLRLGLTPSSLLMEIRIGWWSEVLRQNLHHSFRKIFPAFHTAKSFVQSFFNQLITLSSITRSVFRHNRSRINEATVIDQPINLFITKNFTFRTRIFSPDIPYLIEISSNEPGEHI